MFPVALETFGTGPRRRNLRTADRAVRKAPVKFTSMTAFQSASVMSWIAAGRSIPALATSTCSVPKRCTVSAIIAFTCDIGRDRHCPPAAGRNFANHSRCFFARSQPGRMIYNDRCAQSRKLQRRCTSKPRGRSGNDCHLPGEATKISHHAALVATFLAPASGSVSLSSKLNE